MIYYIKVLVFTHFGYNKLFRRPCVGDMQIKQA